MATTTPESGTPEQLVAGVLSEYGAITRAALFERLPVWEPDSRRLVRLIEYPQRGGRMLLPSLLIASARAFGGRLTDALDAALALELAHTGRLVWADATDGHLRRRGEVALHRQWGVHLALEAGESSQLLSLRAVLESRHRFGPRLTLRLIDEAEQASRRLAEGRTLELGWRRDNVWEIGEAEYLEATLLASCWPTVIHPCRAGALIATRRRIDPGRFVRFGFFLGAAYQIREDVIALISDRTCHGREPDSDLWTGRRTLPLILLAARLPSEDRDRLRAAYRRGHARRVDVHWIRQQLAAHGCVDAARETALGMARAAQREGRRVYGELPDSRDKRFLLALAGWLCEEFEADG